MAAVDPLSILRACVGVLDDNALGALVGVVSAQLLGAGANDRLLRRTALRLVRGAGLEELLFLGSDAESGGAFLTALGPAAPRSKRLVSLAFECATTPSAALRHVEALHAAGALALEEPKTAAALLAGCAPWHADMQGELVGRLLGACDSYAEAGAALASLCEAREGDHEATENDDALEVILRRALSGPDVRDLAGDRALLGSSARLPGGARVIIEGILEEWAAADGSSDDDSDADADGNLAGFVVASGGEEEEPEGGEGAPPTSTESSPQPRKRRRLRGGGVIVDDSESA